MTRPTDRETPVLHFHFDFLSPYAYLAWTQIHDLGARHGRDVAHRRHETILAV